MNDYVCHLVNCGAALIEACQYDNAISLLHQALSVQKGHLQQELLGSEVQEQAAEPRPLQESMHQQQQQGNRQGQECMGVTNIRQRTENHTSMEGGAPTVVKPYSDSLGFGNFIPSKDSVYRQPIRVHSEDMSGISPVAIVFNLALAHHLSGMEQLRIIRNYYFEHPDKNANVLRARHFLTKSLRLYTLAQQLIMQLDQETDANIIKNHQHQPASPSFPIPENFKVVHLLASTNNIGQIYRFAGQHDAANRHFQHLLSSLVYLVDSHKKEGRNRMDDHDGSTTYSGANLRLFIEGLFQSTAHLVLKQCAAGAA